VLAAWSARARGDPLLSLAGVGVRYGDLDALCDVCFDLGGGELVALAGENGAGKSTLVRCIAGELVPERGTVVFDGQAVTTAPGAMARRGVTVVWQDLALCDNLDVAANLLLGRESPRLLVSEARFHARARRVLAELGLPLRDTTQVVGSLSGGQRQLLAVARAMVGRPRLLILDEPTAALGVTETSQVEDLIATVRARGTTVLLVSHDLEQIFRLADRVVVLRHGRLVAEVDPDRAHPDDVIALITGQEVDASARSQLNRLHGLVDRLASAEPSSGVGLVISALGTALGGARLALHTLEHGELRLGAVLGVPPGLAAALDGLAIGAAGGSIGRAASSGEVVVDEDLGASDGGGAWRLAARHERIGASYSVPVPGAGGVLGVLSVFGHQPGQPPRDELELVTLYAGHAAAALERERLLGEVTRRNRVLETIREMLETLAGPSGPQGGPPAALAALVGGLGAHEVGLWRQERPTEPLSCLGYACEGSGAAPSGELSALAAPAAGGPDGRAVPVGPGGLAVAFVAPPGRGVLAARWGDSEVPADAVTLLEDAANSLRLALERQHAEQAARETVALRRSQELQRDFLSRLSHELRTPLTAIRGYATSLLQPDVTWDQASQQRFLGRIAGESARLGRLVEDLLDFSAMESSLFRLHPDWCDLSLVLEAAVACLSREVATQVEVRTAPEPPVVWGDHDRLEQVFVNLVDNALRHNPAGTRVCVEVGPARPDGVTVRVSDDGEGVPEDLLAGPVGAARSRRRPSSGAGLGLSIARGIVEAHGGRLCLAPREVGACFEVTLPTERVGAEPGGSARG